MSQLNEFRDDQRKILNSLIYDLDKLTDKFSKEKFDFFRSIYDQAILTKSILERSCSVFSIAKQFYMPKLLNKELYEQFIYQYLECTEDLSFKLFSLNSTNQIVLIIDHLENYKQNTIDFCNLVQKIVSNLQSTDNLKEYKKLIRLFNNLKSKIEESQIKNQMNELNQSQATDQIRQFNNRIQEILDKYSKNNELDGINFDQFIEDLTSKFIQTGSKVTNKIIERKDRIQKEIDFKLDLIIEKAQISLRTFEEFLTKHQNDELNMFIINTTKALTDFETSFQFSFEPSKDNEDIEFNNFIAAINLSIENFVSKIHYTISDCLERTFYERNNLNDELMLNLTKVAFNTLIKKLSYEKTDLPRDLKLDFKKLFKKDEKRMITFKTNVLRKKLDNLKTKRHKYHKESDIMYKTTDLITIAKGYFKETEPEKTENLDKLKDKDSSKDLSKPQISASKQRFEKIIVKSVEPKQGYEKIIVKSIEPKQGYEKIIVKSIEPKETAKSTKKDTKIVAKELESIKKRINQMFKPKKKSSKKKRK